ncbi:MAG: hypothetical protein D3914_14210, partial [Candidatus Electrothrix sp. LOE2]|nr:hypothetical protein [Candidatus Electrothrix sp. LOE2]
MRNTGYLVKQNIIVFIAFFLLATTGQSGQGKETAKITQYDLTQVKLLDVETAQQIALQDNPGIGAAQARLEQAKAVLKQAAAADKPRVDVSASTGLGRYSDNTYDSIKLGDPSADRNYAAGSLGLQASWLLFDGYARKFQQEQAKYGVTASAASRK